MLSQSQTLLDTIDIKHSDSEYYRTQLSRRRRGCIKMRFTVLKNKNLDAYYRIWDVDERLSEEGLFIKGKKEGIWKSYFWNGTEQVPFTIDYSN